MAVDCLGLQGGEIIERLVPALNSPDALTRAWAIYALSRQPVEDPAHFEALERRLDDPEQDVRWLADQTIRYLRHFQSRRESSPDGALR
jgi:HEAT repeat protein